MEENLPDVEEDNLVSIRFFGFVDEEVMHCKEIYHILQKIQATYEWNDSQLTTAFAAELLLPEDGDELQEEQALLFVRMVATTVPLPKWRISAIYADEQIWLLVLNLQVYGSAEEMATALLERYLIKESSTLVLRVGNVRHLVWLNTLMMEMHKVKMVGVRFHLVFSDSERWKRCLRTATRLLKVFVEHVAAIGTKQFPTPWYNQDVTKWIKGRGLYLTVTDRPNVTTPDGTTESMGTWHIYAEDFLHGIVQEINHEHQHTGHRAPDAYKRSRA
jgi:hypothetical protein